MEPRAGIGGSRPHLELHDRDRTPRCVELGSGAHAKRDPRRTSGAAWHAPGSGAIAGLAESLCETPCMTDPCGTRRTDIFRKQRKPIRLIYVGVADADTCAFSRENLP
ncbi:MAG: hypothetical protein CMH15_17820 [Mesonia sp.]|nr:hypothetical protein [Mesonia sp.]